MELVTREFNGQPYLAVANGQLASESNALDIVGNCVETHRVLLQADDLAPDFFDLRTGLAGAALLKFSNYHLKVAIAIPPERIPLGRFAEFAGETRRNREFRIWHDEQSALDWLLAD